MNPNNPQKNNKQTTFNHSTINFSPPSKQTKLHDYSSSSSHLLLPIIGSNYSKPSVQAGYLQTITGAAVSDGSIVQHQPNPPRHKELQLQNQQLQQFFVNTGFDSTTPTTINNNNNNNNNSHFDSHLVSHRSSSQANLLATISQDSQLIINSSNNILAPNTNTNAAPSDAKTVERILSKAESIRQKKEAMLLKAFAARQRSKIHLSQMNFSHSPNKRQFRQQNDSLSPNVLQQSENTSKEASEQFNLNSGNEENMNKKHSIDPFLRSAYDSNFHSEISLTQKQRSAMTSAPTNPIGIFLRKELPNSQHFSPRQGSNRTPKATQRIKLDSNIRYDKNYKRFLDQQQQQGMHSNQPSHVAGGTLSGFAAAHHFQQQQQYFSSDLDSLIVKGTHEHAPTEQYIQLKQGFYFNQLSTKRGSGQQQQLMNHSNNNNNNNSTATAEITSFHRQFQQQQQQHRKTVSNVIQGDFGASATFIQRGSTAVGGTAIPTHGFSQSQSSNESQIRLKAPVIPALSSMQGSTTDNVKRFFRANNLANLPKKHIQNSVAGDTSMKLEMLGTSSKLAFAKQSNQQINSNGSTVPAIAGVTSPSSTTTSTAATQKLNASTSLHSQLNLMNNNNNNSSINPLNYFTQTNNQKQRSNHTRASTSSSFDYQQQFRMQLLEQNAQKSEFDSQNSAMMLMKPISKSDMNTIGTITDFNNKRFTSTVSSSNSINGRLYENIAKSNQQSERSNSSSNNNKNNNNSNPPSQPSSAKANQANKRNSFRKDLTIQTLQQRQNSAAAAAAAAATTVGEEEDDNELSSPIRNIHHVIKTLSSPPEDSRPQMKMQILQLQRVEESILSESDQTLTFIKQSGTKQQQQQFQPEFFPSNVNSNPTQMLQVQQRNSLMIPADDRRLMNLAMPVNNNNNNNNRSGSGGNRAEDNLSPMKGGLIKLQLKRVESNQDQQSQQFFADQNQGRPLSPIRSNSASNNNQQLIIPESGAKLFTGNGSIQQQQQQTIPNVFLFTAQDQTQLGASSANSSPTIPREQGSMRELASPTSVIPEESETAEQNNETEIQQDQPLEEGEFVMKRVIDFSKLKEIRDKTINRLSYAKPTTPAGSAAASSNTASSPGKSPSQFVNNNAKSPNYPKSKMQQLAANNSNISAAAIAAAATAAGITSSTPNLTLELLKQQQMQLMSNTTSPVKKMSLASAASKISIGSYFKKGAAGGGKKGPKKANQNAAGAAGSAESGGAPGAEVIEETEAEIEEKRTEFQRIFDRIVAEKLEQAKDKLRSSLKNFPFKKAASIAESAAPTGGVPSSTGITTTTTTQTAQNVNGNVNHSSPLSFYDQQRETQEHTSIVMRLVTSVIDNFNENKSPIDGTPINPQSQQQLQLPATAMTSSTTLQQPLNAGAIVPGTQQTNGAMNASISHHQKAFQQHFYLNEQLVKALEQELRKANLSVDEVDRFKAIYEITTKMQMSYANMIATFGGIDKMNGIVDSLVKKLSAHITILPINHVYSFESMHRRLIPGICALLCDDFKLFRTLLRAFQARDLDFSFIDFYFVKKEAYSLLTKQHCDTISSNLALAVLQKIESVRRYVFPITVLCDSELREEVAKKLVNTEKFLALFRENSITESQIAILVNRIFDYFYADIEINDMNEIKTIRGMLEPYLLRKLSRKVIDYIEVVTQSSLQEDRFTRNVILRDLHYKFTKLRLKLGFKQGIFGVFSPNQKEQLIEHVRDEVVNQIKTNPEVQQNFDSTELGKTFDLTFLKSYLRFLLSEYDIFSVYDYSVAIPYLAVSYPVFKFQVACIRTVLTHAYEMQTSQANILIRFIEACCPLYE